MTIHINSRPQKITLRYFWISSIFLIICLIALWVFQVQLLARNSELLSSSQIRLAELSKENKEPAAVSLSNEVAELDKLAHNLGFEKIDKVHYIRALEITVLAK